MVLKRTYFTLHRLLSWMLTGTASDTVPTDKSVALSSIGWDQSATTSFFRRLFDSVEDCDAEGNYSDCYSDADLVIVGAQAPAEDATEIATAIREAMDSGSAVLFLHTETWADSVQGTAVLTERMTYGDNGGNYRSADKAEGSVDDMLAVGGAAGSIITLLEHLELGDYDLTERLLRLGQTFCDEVPGIYTEFYHEPETVQQALRNLDPGQAVPRRRQSNENDGTVMFIAVTSVTP